MDCIFCKISNGDIPSYTVYENDYVRCFLDINPVANGHTLVVPKKHFLDNEDITSEYIVEVQKASKVVMSLLKEKLSPDGIRLVQNNGSLQEVKHYHLHIIPSYNKKTTKKDVQKIYELLSK